MNYVREMMNELISEVDQAIENERFVVCSINMNGLTKGDKFIPTDFEFDREGLTIFGTEDDILSIEDAYVSRAEKCDESEYKFVFTLGGYILITII